MTVLSVNVNKVALLRNARGGNDPDIVWAAQTCIEAGAGGITVHPRPDQRHIRVDDVFTLAKMVSVEYNIEGNPFEGEMGGYPGFMEILEKVRPNQATLVPDSVDQITSNHGWDLATDGHRLRPLVARLKDLGCRVSLFMDPIAENMPRAAETGADRIELYTEDYARAYASGDHHAVLTRYAEAAEAATAAGLGINAGHDLNLHNLKALLGIGNILEVSIGQALIADALRFGLYATVQRYLACLTD